MIEDISNDDELFSEDDEFMEELEQEYRETVARNIVQLNDLHSEGRWEEISKIAHDIKGTSGIFGYDEGTEIARDLNVAAKQQEIDKIKPLIDKLAAYMKENGIIS